jgi:hypothetical protein
MPKVTVKHSFKDQGKDYEEGNTHDIEDEARVEMWRKAGWVDVEGKEESPDIDPQRVVRLETDNVKHEEMAQDATPGGRG